MNRRAVPSQELTQLQEKTEMRASYRGEGPCEGQVRMAAQKDRNEKGQEKKFLESCGTCDLKSRGRDSAVSPQLTALPLSLAPRCSSREWCPGGLDVCCVAGGCAYTAAPAAVALLRLFI